MSCVIGLLLWHVPDWWLLELCVLGSIGVAGDLEINMSINRLHQLLHTGGVFVVGSISLALNRGEGESGTGFALDLLVGNLRALLSLEGLPAIPPRTHEAWPNGRRAPRISRHRQSPCHTTYFHRLQGSPSDWLFHQPGPS